MVRLLKNKLREDHPNILTSMNNLIINYSKARRGLKALQLLEKVVRLQKNKLGEDHPDILTLMNNLVINYSKARRGLEALQLLEEVLRLRKNKLGEDHSDTLTSIELHAYIVENAREELPKPLGSSPVTISFVEVLAKDSFLKQIDVDLTRR